MMENKIQKGPKSLYEPVAVRVQQINPTGVLCQSGGGTVTGVLNHDSSSYSF